MKKTGILFWLLCLLGCLLPTAPLYATHYYFRQISLEAGNGLLSTLKCIYADSQGYVWMGTQSGLGRFNGHELKRILHRDNDDTSLPGNTVYQVMEDGRQQLWVLTGNGVAHYDYHHNTFTTLTHDNGEKVVAYSACCWKDGLLLGGDNEVYYYDQSDGSVRRICQIATDEQFELLGLALTDDHTLLCRSRWQGIWRVNLHNGDYRRDSFGCGNEFTDMLVDEHHRIWLAPYNQGVKCFSASGTQLADYTTENSGLSNDIALCLALRGNELWIGTDGGGINILDRQTHRFRHLTHTPGDKTYSLPTNSINCLHNDRNDQLWIGGVYNGLISMRQVNMTTYTDLLSGFNRGVSHNIVLSLYEQDGYLWIGTDGGGVNRFDMQTETFTYYAPTAELKVASICGFTPGQLLISTFAQGLFVFDTRSGRLTPFTIINDKTNARLCRHGNIVNVYRNSPHTVLLLADHVYLYDLRRHTFETATEDHRCKIYLGSLKSIGHDANSTYLYDLKHIYELDHHSRHLRLLFACNREMNLNTVDRDRQGNFWMGTNRGLNKFDPEKGEITPIPTRLLSEITSMIFDPSGKLWIGADNSLLSYEPAARQFVIYDQSDGTQPNEYLPQARLLHGDKIYLGGVKGLLHIDTGDIINETDIPDLQLSDLIVNGESRGRLSDEDLGRLSLPYKSNLTLMFMAKEKDIFRKRYYRYRIRELGNAYTELPTPEISLTGLQPGTYHVLASCTLRDGSWTEEQRIAVLRVLPPWYRSTWFISGCLILVPLAIACLVLRALRRKEEKLARALQRHEQQVNEDKVRFLINISHELRTPLTLIYAPLKRILQQMPAEAALYPPLKSIFRQTQRMTNLINMVLDLRKMEVGHIQLHFEPHPLNEWLQAVAQDFITAGKERHVGIRFQLDPAVGTVCLDREKCEIILTNLLINALKHSPEHTVITLGSELLPDGGRVRISIADEGSGLGDTDPDRLFTRFYQGENERNGTGIGLSYSKILVEQHGGSIGACNNPGAGTTFYFELPTTQASDTVTCPPNAYLNELMDNSLQETLVQPDGPPFDTTAYTLLLVDDNTDLTDFLKNALKGRYKKVLTAQDGQEALQLLQSHRPDVVISDVMMPRMDGYQLCRSIKENLDISHIPVILLTAKSDRQSVKDGYQCGADAYLPKPFEVEMLEEVIINRLKSIDNIRRKYAGGHTMPLPEEATISQADETFLLRLNECIRQHLDNSLLDTALLCREMGMSRASLFNKLKALTGMGSNEYITRIRMEKAIQLVEGTDLSFTEIAEQTGFATSSYFSTSFKQYTGETPTRYRKRIKNP